MEFSRQENWSGLPCPPPGNLPDPGWNLSLSCLLHWQAASSAFFFFLNFNWWLITLQYCGGFCHTFTWISHGCTGVPPRVPLSHLPPHPVPQGHPSVPALSTLSHASNLDWRSISHMIIYMFQCYPLKSSHPPLLPPSPKSVLYICASSGRKCYGPNRRTRY